MRLRLYPQECCDKCHEIVNNYIDCPVCGRRAETNLAGPVWELDVGDTIECGECRVEFVLVDKSDAFNYEWELHSVNGKGCS